MPDYDFDFFVIGGGSGGVRAARIAAGYGAKVGLAEEYRVGGTCVIRGCVPKKLLVYGAHMAEEFADSAGFGWTVDKPAFDWPTLRDRVQAEVTRLNGLYTQTQEKAGVSLFYHRAVFTGPNSLDVGGQTITAKHILIATGARPVYPDCPGADLGITSNEAFHLEALPQSIVIAGGGYIASEFAGIFHGLGVEVTQLYRGQVLLKGWDMELRQRLQEAYVAKGIKVHTGAYFTKIEKTASGVACHLTDGAVLEAEMVMHAIGRLPNTAALGLELAGVAVDDVGAVKVTPDSQTTAPHIYAVGDVTNRVNLTPVAIKEGHAVADTLFGGKPWTVDHGAVASAVFSQPPLASVGLSQEQAIAAGHDVQVFRSDFRPMKATLSGRSERTLCKLIVDKATDRVLGAHMIGTDSPEIIQALAIPIKFGVTKAQFDQTIAVHPTAAEEFVLMR
jgi:glutathione reductase (NADPH)